MSEPAASRPEPPTAETTPTPVTHETAPPPPPPPPPPPAVSPAAPGAGAAPRRLVLFLAIAFVAGALMFAGFGAVAGFAIGHRVGEHQSGWHHDRYGPDRGDRVVPKPQPDQRRVPQPPRLPNPAPTPSTTR